MAWGAEHESGATDAVDQLDFVAGIDLSAQMPEVNIDEIRLRYETIVPEFLEDHGTGYQLAFVVHEVF